MKKIVSMFLAVAVVFGMGLSRSATAEEFCPVSGDDAVTRILVPIRQKYKMPAMAAAIVSSRGIETAGAVGVRKMGDQTPVTVNDQWHLGSDTKAMTATLVGRLVERGLLKWDSTVSGVFPDLAPNFHPDVRQVTILQLLSHRAGIRRDPDFVGLAKAFNLKLPDMSPGVPNPKRQLESCLRSLSTLAPIAKQRLEAVRQGLSQPPLHPPGGKWLYSNLGYLIVGAMVERVTGKTWEEEMETEIFAPLKMDKAGFGGLGTQGQVDQPWGHTLNKAGEKSPEVSPTLINLDYSPTCWTL